MGQRKLTREELQHVEKAAWYLQKITYLGGHAVYASIVLGGLGNMAKERTTDGKPWIEPQPEIGEGYRRATWADKDRRDRSHWDSQLECWYCSETASYDTQTTYRVPVDRIPTDEDARQRPTVMVRDNDKQDWQARKLLAVTGCLDKFVTSSSYGVACFWMQARFPYPGELD